MYREQADLIAEQQLKQLRICCIGINQQLTTRQNNTWDLIFILKHPTVHAIILLKMCHRISYTLT